MNEPEQAPPGAPRSVGEALRERREEQGLALADVGQRTRVPVRHLEAIEAGDYARLPSVTYAVGFARAYARSVGADEVAVAAEVRREVGRQGRTRPEYEPYVTADPARLPSRGLAAVTLGLAVAVAVLAVLWFTTDLFRPGASAAGTPAAEAVTASVPQLPSQAAAPAAPANQVRLTATDEVWVRVYDGANKTMKIGTMAAGEAYDVPRDAVRPMINVGRPDKLTVSLDGRALPPLGDGSRPIKDVAVDAAALSGRLSGGAGPSPAAGA